MLISAVQQCDSFIHVYSFSYSFPLWFTQGIGYNSLCYIPGLCCLSILDIIVCICKSRTPNLSLLSHSPLATKSLFSMSVSLFLFCRWVHLCHILYCTYKWYHMVFVSFSDLLHLVWEFLGPSMLLQMALFHSLYGWVIFHSMYVCMCIYVCMYRHTYACVCVFIYTHTHIYTLTEEWVKKMCFIHTHTHIYIYIYIYIYI